MASKSLQFLGATQLVCGIMASLTGMMCVFELCWAHFLYLNCWTGAMYIIVGLLTMVSARLRNSQLALANVLFTSVTILLSFMSGAMNSVGVLNELELKWYLMPSIHLFSHDNHWKNRLTGSNKRFSLHIAALLSDILQCVISLPQTYLEFHRYMSFHQSNGHCKINKNYGIDTTGCSEAIPILPLLPKQCNVIDNHRQMAMYEEDVVFFNPIHASDVHHLSNITLEAGNVCERGMHSSNYSNNHKPASNSNIKLNLTRQQPQIDFMRKTNHL